MKKFIFFIFAIFLQGKAYTKIVFYRKNRKILIIIF